MEKNKSEGKQKSIIKTEEEINKQENHSSEMEKLLYDFFEKFKKENKGYIDGKAVGPVALNLQSAFERLINIERNVKKNNKEYIQTIIGLILRDFDDINIEKKYKIMDEDKDDEEVKKRAGKYLLELSLSLE
jgi:hypothetical protein